MATERSSANDSIAPGMAGQEISNTQYNRFGTKGGAGFAFEDINALEDTRAGRSVKQVGETNAPNGADRIVNGQAIQSKCFGSARQSVMDAFADGGKGSYRYEGSIGSGGCLERRGSQCIHEDRSLRSQRNRSGRASLLSRQMDQPFVPS